MTALANAKRLAGFFDEAKAAIRSAKRCLEEGTGDPLEEANVISVESSLYRNLGQLEQAAAVLDHAISICREVGDGGRCAGLLLQKATALGMTEPTRRIELLEDALVTLDPAQEPRLGLCARHNLALFLDDAGRPGEALAMLEMSRPFYRAFGDRHTQLLLHWLEARIARSLGDLAEAEAVLERVSSNFGGRRMHYERTMASIDLVEVYSLGGKFEKASALVDELQPVLASWGVHAEGQAMWMIFRNSVVEHAKARASVATPAFRGIASYFHRAWHQPMRFVDPKPS